jgi:hypothetical protein
MGYSRFEYGFEFAEKIDFVIVKFGFRGLIETAETDFFCYSSPLTGRFSYSCKYVMYICICFCYSIPLKELRANIRFAKASAV